MNVECTVAPQIFGGNEQKFTIPCDTIANMLGEAVDVPGLVVHLNGHQIERQYWHLVTPKEGTRLDVLAPVHGGGQQSGGKKNTLAVIATLVVAAAAIAVSGGALGAVGIPALAGFTAGSTAASIAGAVVGLPGGLCVASLVPATPIPA